MEAEILRTFVAFDQGNKGWLSRQDIKCAVTALLGYRPSKYEVKQMFYGKEDEQGVDQQLFSQVMQRRMALRDPRDEVRSIFKLFDIEGRGFLTLEGVLQVFEEMCPAITKEKVLELFLEVDRDKVQRISLYQFEWIMQKSAPRLYPGP